MGKSETLSARDTRSHGKILALAEARDGGRCLIMKSECAITMEDTIKRIRVATATSEDNYYLSSLPVSITKLTIQLIIIRVK